MAFLRACCALFIIGPPVNTPASRGGHRQEDGETGLVKQGRRGASSVVFNTSGATAKKTDKDKQKDGKGRDTRKQGDEVWRKGGVGGLIRPGCFVGLGDAAAVYEVLFLSGLLCSTGNKSDRIHSR